jgi:hypothetical protein
MIFRAGFALDTVGSFVNGIDAFATDTAMPGKLAHMREDAMIKDLLMISAFTLIFVVSASAQVGMRRGDQRLMGEQQRRDLYEQRRSELMPYERRDNTMLAEIRRQHVNF